MFRLSVPSPWQSAQCLDLATCDLGATVNSCHEWSFPFLSGRNLLWALCWPDDHVDMLCVVSAHVHVCAHPKKREGQQPLLALIQEVQLQRSGKHRLNWRNSAAKLNSLVWENKPKEPVGSYLKLRVLRTLGLPHQTILHSASLHPPTPTAFSEPRGQQTCATQASFPPTPAETLIPIMMIIPLPKGVLEMGPEESVPINLHTLGKVIIKSILHRDVHWCRKGGSWDSRKSWNAWALAPALPLAGWVSVVKSLLPLWNGNNG